MNISRFCFWTHLLKSTVSSPLRAATERDNNNNNTLIYGFPFTNKQTSKSSIESRLKI